MALDEAVLYYDKAKGAIAVLNIVKAELEARMQVGKMKIADAREHGYTDALPEMEKRMRVYQDVHQRIALAQDILDRRPKEELHTAIDELE